MQEEKKFVTTEECSELSTAMEKKFRLALKGRNFSIEASQDANKVQVQVLLKNKEESFYYPVEARILFKSEELEPYDAALFLIDYIDTYFEEFLLEEEEDLYLPIDWSDHEYEAVSFQVRGQIINKKLEDMATAFMEQHGGLEEV